MGEQIGFGKNDKKSVKSVSNRRLLAMPAAEWSAETLNQVLRGVSSGPGGFLLLAGDKPEVIFLPFREKATSRDERFGKLTDSKRFALKTGVTDTIFVGGGLSGEKFFALDGSSLIMHAFDSKTLDPIISHSLVWDTVRPASDAKGLAPKREVASIRSRWGDAWKKAKAPKISAISEMPSTWGKSADKRFLAITSMAQFPIAEIVCSSDEPTRCRIDQSCFVEGFDPKVQITALTVDPVRREVLLGIDRAIYAYKYNSCFHISAVKGRQWLIPDAISGISGLLVENGRLWLTAPLRDGFLNASLYGWPAGSW